MSFKSILAPFAVGAQLLFGLTLAVLPAVQDDGAIEPPSWDEDKCPEWLCGGS